VALFVDPVETLLVIGAMTWRYFQCAG